MVGVIQFLFLDHAINRLFDHLFEFASISLFTRLRERLQITSHHISAQASASVRSSLSCRFRLWLAAARKHAACHHWLGLSAVMYECDGASLTSD